MTSPARRPTNGHRVLIVEDHPPAAALLAQIVIALGCDPRIVATVEEALEALAEESFCGFLVDQELPAYRDSMPLSGGGLRVMRAIRTRDNRRHEGRYHITFIIVVTGYSAMPDFVSQMWEEGADGFFCKPITPENIPKLHAMILGALERAQRATHDRCAALALPLVDPNAEPQVRVLIDGVKRRGRSTFLVNGERRELQDAKFSVLLRLVAALESSPGEMAPKASVGLARSRDATTHVRKAFAGLLPKDFELIEGDGHGSFRLNPRVVLESVEWRSMMTHPNAAVQKIAREMAAKASRAKK